MYQFHTAFCINQYFPSTDNARLSCQETNSLLGRKRSRPTFSPFSLCAQRGVCYKWSCTPTLLLCSLQRDVTTLSKGVVSLNKRRESYRRERIRLVKGRIAEYLKDSQFARSLSLTVLHNKVKHARLVHIRDLHSSGMNTSSLVGVKKENADRRVSQGFTNSLMRHGARLRYQGVLRKALLAL